MNVFTITKLSSMQMSLERLLNNDAARIALNKIKCQINSMPVVYINRKLLLQRQKGQKKIKLKRRKKIILQLKKR